MLTTFENAHWLHQRRDERDRHMRAMEACAKGLHNPDESFIAAMVDALSGNPLQKKYSGTGRESCKTRKSSETTVTIRHLSCWPTWRNLYLLAWFLARIGRRTA